MSGLDRRFNAFRPDLADERLRGRVSAARFAEGRRMRTAAPVLDVLSRPRFDAGLDTQMLAGETVTVFDEAEGFAWVQGERDGYVGYVAADALAKPGTEPTHVVAVPRTFAYRQPDMKTRVTAAHSLGAAVRVTDAATTRGTDYALLDDGTALIAAHLHPVGATAADWVAEAEALERTPYLWGGASAFGIDCSGLVQLSMRMAGRNVPRDTDMQAGSIGSALSIGEDLSGLARGDLVFWKGHVAIMTDGRSIIHANGHTMAVTREPLRVAVDRIAYLYGRPTAFRRP